MYPATQHCQREDLPGALVVVHLPLRLQCPGRHLPPDQHPPAGPQELHALEVTARVVAVREDLQEQAGKSTL